MICFVAADLGCQAAHLATQPPGTVCCCCFPLTPYSVPAAPCSSPNNRPIHVSLPFCRSYILPCCITRRSFRLTASALRSLAAASVAAAPAGPALPPARGVRSALFSSTHGRGPPRPRGGGGRSARRASGPQPGLVPQLRGRGAKLGGAVPVGLRLQPPLHPQRRRCRRPRCGAGGLQRPGGRHTWSSGSR